MAEVGSSSPPAGSLLDDSEQAPDPRGRGGSRSPLLAMLAASVCAMLSGFHGDTAMVRSVHLQDVLLWHLLGLTRRPPGHDCFRDLLMAVDSQTLSDALMRGTAEGLGITIGEGERQAVIVGGKVFIRENAVKPGLFFMETQRGEENVDRDPMEINLTNIQVMAMIDR